MACDSTLANQLSPSCGPEWPGLRLPIRFKHEPLSARSWVPTGRYGFLENGTLAPSGQCDLCFSCVSIYMGVLSRTSIEMMNHVVEANGRPVVQDVRDRDRLMDEEYLRYVHATDTS